MNITQYHIIIHNNNITTLKYHYIISYHITACHIMNITQYHVILHNNNITTLKYRAHQQTVEVETYYFSSSLKKTLVPNETYSYGKRDLLFK